MEKKTVPRAHLRPYTHSPHSPSHHHLVSFFAPYPGYRETPMLINDMSNRWRCHHRDEEKHHPQLMWAWGGVRNIHKYPLFILGIYTNYSFLFLLSSYLRLLFLVNSVLCLEWYSSNVTIYLHKLVKGNLVKRATEHLTPAEFQYTSTLGSALLKHLQAATITLRPRPRPSGIQK